jgi:hypothetical protein
VGGWTGDLLTAVAQRLDDAGIGTWDPDGTTGSIVHGALPDEIDNGIGLTAYNLTNRRTSLSGEVTQPIQFFLRGTLAQVEQAADDLYAAFNGLRDTTLGSTRLTLIELHSDVPMGIDQRGRIERAVNYDFWATRTTAQTP